MIAYVQAEEPYAVLSLLYKVLQLPIIGM